MGWGIKKTLANIFISVCNEEAFARRIALFPYLKKTLLHLIWFFPRLVFPSSHCLIYAVAYIKQNESRARVSRLSHVVSILHFKNILKPIRFAW